ncbi:anthrone oxygenase family protein [Derxia lacustris]|uniref:anthrone oxygenase family protein n=1 Tax=Derxia lacustris TaxID=764842 RepID=UPI000A176CBB|nr:anthrone oxygenase family protein [Derxia lacustris]
MKHFSASKSLFGLAWILVSAWAIALGAKIFDLLVLATAWGASPPASFQHLPYGKDYPIDPGNFFQPLSALLLLANIGALLLAWRSPARKIILASFASLIVIWIFTPTVFWPMIAQLWEIHRGRLAATDAETIALVHRWFILDSGRIVLIFIGFIHSVRFLIALESRQDD